MSAVSINVEPYDPEAMEDCKSPRNEKKSQENKRGCGGCCGKKCSTIAFWIMVACAVLLCAGLTAYFLTRSDPKPEPPITPTIPPITTTAPTATPQITTTIEPTTTKPQCFPIRWLKDEPILSANNPTMRASLFTGQVPHHVALNICSRMDKALITNSEVFGQKFGVWRGALYFNDTEEEKRFDRIIRANIISSSENSSIFGNIKVEHRMMWTGCYYVQDKTGWVTRCSQDPSTGYNNFCDQQSWETELKELKADANQGDYIYIVKDYGRKNNGCWKLFLEKGLTDILESDIITPHLSLSCIMTDQSSTSGQEAIKKADIDLCKVWDES